MIQIQNKSLIIVFRGDFNPSIFQPSWFSKNDLISDSESEGANLRVIIPDISDFNTDWFSLQVTRDRFLIKTSQESHFEALGDLVLGTFTLQSHILLRQMGINFDGNVKMKDLKTWNGYGDKLTPKEIWRKKLKNPGMSLLQVKSDRDDKYKGYILVTVKPSESVDFGVDFHINDHYEIENIDKMENTKSIIDIFRNEKEKSVIRSVDIINSLLEVE